jgi:hypothetical protein
MGGHLKFTSCIIMWELTLHHFIAPTSVFYREQLSVYEFLIETVIKSKMSPNESYTVAIRIN